MIVTVRALTVLFTCAFVVACSGQASPRLAEADKYLSSHNNVSYEVRAALEKGQVIKGMSLQEASIAGGPYISAIDRDRAVWPNENADPWQILEAQQLHPDNSKINLLSQNVTQFNTQQRVQFTAVFARGRVVRIERGWDFLPPKRP